MGVLDDASGIRNGTSEIFVFSLFSVAGLLGFVFGPPIKHVDLRRVFFPVDKSGQSRSTVVVTWLLFLVNVVFFCFYCALFAAFGLQSQLVDVQLYDSTLYLIPLGVGAGAAVLGTIGGTYVWLFVLNVHLFDLLWTLTTSCVTFACFAGTLGIVLMISIILEGCFVIICPVLRLEQIVLFYSSLVVCFCVVFAPATAIMGIEYWYQHNGTGLILLVAVLGAAALRPITIRLLSNLSCCRKWAGRINNAKEAMQEESSTSSPVMDKPEIEDEKEKLLHH